MLLDTGRFIRISEKQTNSNTEQIVLLEHLQNSSIEHICSFKVSR